ncbi:MAG: DUF4920 domain-containing protein [Thermoanaerobaculia bacterium]|nr:DUF4920 domain-containing protein [Thermoanaerobaculia bacterium]
MKLNRYALAAFVLLALALPPTATEATDSVSGTYGEAPTLEDVTPIADIVANPEAFQGREVLVEGKVQGVCAKAGCWMELADGEGHEVRVKVEDGVIVFPVAAVGVNAAAQGTVSVHDMSRDEYLGWQRHLAEEMGEEFDESSIGEGPYQLVQIAGTGAHIDG